MTTKRIGWVGLVALLGACGGGSSSTPPPATTTTSGSEAPPPYTCSVPHAPDDANFQSGMRAIENHESSGVAMLDTSCTAGNPCACSALAEVYAQGQLADTDIDRAIQLADSACTGGEMYGCYHAGAYRWLRRPSETDVAIERYGVACDDHFADACIELGRLAMSGISHEGQTEAMAYYDDACQHDAPRGCMYEGAIMWTGDPPMNPTRGSEHLEFACLEALVPEACTEMGRLTVATNPAGATEAWQHACDLHDPFACDALLPQDEAAARQGTAADALDLTGTGAEHASIVVESPATDIEVTSGGEVDISQLGLRPSCTGVVTRDADLVIEVAANVQVLDLTINALTDTTIAVRDPAGGWHCADDQPTGSYNPSLHVATPAAGAWTVWVGRFTPGTTHATVHLGAQPPPPTPPPAATPPARGRRGAAAPAHAAPAHPPAAPAAAPH
jgi:TPR repeat protein